MKFEKAVSDFGAKAKSKLSNPAAKGAPEDQLRAPLETLFADIDAARIQPTTEEKSAPLELIGETNIPDISARPDYAVVKNGALIGHIEIKAPGKGADPRKFKGHDKAQWDKLKRLPNLIYTDGNAFSLWHNGEISDAVVRLEGDIEESGAKLAAPSAFEDLIQGFFNWEPAPPRSTKQLAETSARLCRVLRDQVIEALDDGNKALEDLQGEWRELLFPQATKEQFADGYAQAVTFGLLIAKAEEISLADGIEYAALKLRKSNSLIGAALRLLTDKPETQKALGSALKTLVRVLDKVDWQALTNKDAEEKEADKTSPWLYFYENFLEVYDNQLRKQTGSYYTPPEVVDFMVRMVDEALQDSNLFNLGLGLADKDVKISDPAVGTGTYLLGVLRRMAQIIEDDKGPGAVPSGINQAVKRLIGFEAQFGPFAVAQLRLLAELKRLCKGQSDIPELRLFLTDTLGDPYAEETQFSSLLEAIGKSRRSANEIKRKEKITVVIGNPPYKEKAKGRGGWIETGSDGFKSPLHRWLPHKKLNIGGDAKHLYNLYVYFWRWAMWKVFGSGLKETTGEIDESRAGIICFITVAGFLNGPGFQIMRADLQRECSDIWVIDCTPEGHQPNIPTRIFQGVQQPVCIVMAARPADVDQSNPARIHLMTLPNGSREDKFKALAGINLSDKDWEDGEEDWGAPFLPKMKGAWSSFPALADVFAYNGCGVMPGRTWVIAPDEESLEKRWAVLAAEKTRRKRFLFHPHPGGQRTSLKPCRGGLAGHEFRPQSVANDTGAAIPPVRYAHRSFNRQWILPDKRLINAPNPNLWNGYSEEQVYLTGLKATSPKSGPACTLCGDIPDLDHYKGSFGGRVFPLWRDAKASEPNIKPGILSHVGKAHKRTISAKDMMAYIACVLVNPNFTDRFKSDLRQPGLRVPITADAALFEKAVSVGAEVIWLHTYGERFYDKKAERPHQPPRMKGKGPSIPAGGDIPGKPEELPDSIDYDAATKTLIIGGGRIENVPSAVWNYEISGMKVLKKWFSYRKNNRSKPPMGDKRPPSPLQAVQPDYWLPQYTDDLFDMLHVLGRLVELEPKQKDILERICNGPLITNAVLEEADAFEVKKGKGPKKNSRAPVADLLD